MEPDEYVFGKNKYKRTLSDELGFSLLCLSAAISVSFLAFGVALRYPKFAKSSEVTCINGNRITYFENLPLQCPYEGIFKIDSSGNYFESFFDESKDGSVDGYCKREVGGISNFWRKDLGDSLEVDLKYKDFKSEFLKTEPKKKSLVILEQLN